VQDSADRISVLVNVLGFQEKDLKVSIEPSRISILGKKEGSAAGGHSLDRHPDRILQCIDLATEVVPESAVVELEEGQLKFELHKVERKLETTVPAA
jgi:HSP20 family molecular chaperone IbpA